MTSKVRVPAWLPVAGLLLLLPTAAADAKTFTYRVRHLHAVGSCQGLLRISETEVRYESDYRADARIWTYADIKSVDRKDLRKLIINTYEDQTTRLGRDKTFDFDFMDGDITDEFFNFMSGRVGHAGPPSPPGAPPGGRWEIAAKHQHLFGGCEGTLKVTPTHIEYVTDDSNDARLWKYVDIKRFDSPSAYKLSLYTYEDQTLLLGRDKVFRFDLKEPLEPAVSQYIRQQMNR